MKQPDIMNPKAFGLAAMVFSLLITNDFGNRENPVIYIQVLRACAFLCDVEVLRKDLFEFLQCISQQ